MSVANPNLYGADAVNTADMKLKRWASSASLAVATILIVAKISAFLITNSVSLLSSLMDSCFDALASLVTMLAIIHAASPADEDHRFGHGKLEALGALGQAIFVIGSALFLLIESVRRVISPEIIRDPAAGLGVMLLSIILTMALIAFQQYVIRKTKSVAISADYLHYKGDVLMNLSVLCALGLSYYTGWAYFDPLFAAMIAAVLLHSAYKILRESSDILMDKELPVEEREKIMALVTAHPAVESIHDLRTRNTGERMFIEFHLELDGDLTLHQAHDVTEDLERELYAAFPKAEVLTHPEPAGLDDHRIDHSIAQQAKPE